MSTLTYVYRDQTAVLGPLATYAEPHCYDLCAEHARRLTVPRGWDVVRLPADYTAPATVSQDDWLAVADAVREAPRGAGDPPAESADPHPPSAQQAPGRPAGPDRRRGHLRVLPDA